MNRDNPSPRTLDGIGARMFGDATAASSTWSTDAHDTGELWPGRGGAKDMTGAALDEVGRRVYGGHR